MQSDESTRICRHWHITAYVPSPSSTCPHVLHLNPSNWQEYLQNSGFSAVNNVLFMTPATAIPCQCIQHTVHSNTAWKPTHHQGTSTTCRHQRTNPHKEEQRSIRGSRYGERSLRGDQTKLVGVLRLQSTQHQPALHQLLHYIPPQLVRVARVTIPTDLEGRVWGWKDKLCGVEDVKMKIKRLRCKVFFGYFITSQIQLMVKVLCSCLSLQVLKAAVIGKIVIQTYFYMISLFLPRLEVGDSIRITLVRTLVISSDKRNCQSTVAYVVRASRCVFPIISVSVSALHAIISILLAFLLRDIKMTANLKMELCRVEDFNVLLDL